MNETTSILPALHIKRVCGEFSLREDARVVVVGASAGGVNALLRLLPDLSPSFPPVLIVLHIGQNTSHLPELISARGVNRAVVAQNGVTPEPGTIYFAPPAQHLLLEDGRLRLFRGPKEHHARPAINPLFRSAALDSGRAVIGVILTGMLDDGAAGLHAVKACGGITVVQDPGDAAEPSMPCNALAATPADYVLRLDAMADLLNKLVQEKNPGASRAPEWLRTEHAVSLGNQELQALKTIGDPSPFTCPDCGGTLFELHEKPVRFLCHTGHGFSLLSLAFAQAPAADTALWAALRAIQEKEEILRRLAIAQDGDKEAAQATLAEADSLAQFAAQLRQVITADPVVETNLEDTVTGQQDS